MDDYEMEDEETSKAKDTCKDNKKR